MQSWEISSGMYENRLDDKLREVMEGREEKGERRMVGVLKRSCEVKEREDAGP